MCVGLYMSVSRAGKKILSKKQRKALTGSSHFPDICASVAYQQLCISATTDTAVSSPLFVPV